MLKKKVDVICKTPVLENRVGINHNMINVELPIGEIIHLIRRGNQVYEVLPNGKRIFLTMDNVELDNSTRTIAAEYMEDASPVKDGRSIEQAIHNSGIERTPKGGNGSSWHPGGGVHVDPKESQGPGNKGDGIDHGIGEGPEKPVPDDTVEDGHGGGVNVPPHQPSIPKNKEDHGGDPTPDPGTQPGPGNSGDPTPEPPLGVDGGIDEDANNASGDGKQGKKNQDDDGHTEIG